jgi:hypothetical protein
MTIWRIRVSCWITKATNTHSEYVIIVFLRQQWLHESASVLRYTRMACLVAVLTSSCKLLQLGMLLLWRILNMCVQFIRTIYFVRVKLQTLRGLIFYWWVLEIISSWKFPPKPFITNPRLQTILNYYPIEMLICLYPCLRGRVGKLRYSSTQFKLGSWWRWVVTLRHGQFAPDTH